MARLTRHAFLVTGVVALVVCVAFVLVRSTLIWLSLFAAIVIGEGLRPLVRALSARMPRPAAITLAYLALILGLALVWFVPLRALLPEAGEFSSSLPALIAAAIAALRQVVPVSSALGPIAQFLVHAPAQVSTVLSVFGLTLLMLAFWLSSSEGLSKFILSLAPEDRRESLSALFGEISANLSAYVVGVVVNGSMVGLECWAALTLIQAPFPGILGLFQALVTTIPYLGPLLGMLAVAVIVFAKQGLTSAAIAVAAVGVMHAIQGAFIAPLIFKRAVNIDPLLTVVATAIGGTLFGLLGVVLAVPAASTLQTLFIRVVAPAIRNSYVAAPKGQ